ncbi:AAA family ATPase [Herbidospora sp. NEAU-GS84]|uniref:AAA family ATPase n=1 Tax=Herbidospora solisilvae TaxID=2696284 RepID=A0A7C9J9A3_9ACTN|nr:ParA family protein [Herbidospora solisilvae]NAS27460.1 AAA family ATPase [Herbidospora solisilvae]
MKPWLLARAFAFVTRYDGGSRFRAVARVTPERYGAAMTAPHQPQARMRITAVVNQKGGVGKTTTTINLGGALAEMGARVLLVDLDPQGHLSDALKLPEAGAPAPLGAALLGALPDDPGRIVLPHSITDTGGVVDVVPTAFDMLQVTEQLYQVKAREQRLSRLLARLADRYDHCLIDCPPSLDLLTVNALEASDGAVIPVQLEDSSVKAMRLLLAEVEAVDLDLRPGRPLTLHGMVVSMLERGAEGKPKTVIARSVLASFKQLEAEGLPILAQVPRGIPISEAWRFGQTVSAYAPNSEHAAAFRDVAKVVDAAR